MSTEPSPLDPVDIDQATQPTIDLDPSQILGASPDPNLRTALDSATESTAADQIQEGWPGDASIEVPAYDPAQPATGTFAAVGAATGIGGAALGLGGPDAGGHGGGPTFPPTSASDSGAEPPKKKRRGAMIGVGIGILGLAGGAAFAITQIKGTEKANTPEQAIETFYTSFENGDAIGLAKTLAPGERDVMLDSLVPMLAEMSRLKVLEKDFDPAKIKGYTAKLSAFKAKSTVVRPDLAHVVVTSGKLSTTFNPNDLPFGDFVRKLGGDDLKSSKSTTQSTDIGSDAKSPFVVQKIGKRWYLSFNYSLAESARLGSEDVYKVPLKGAGVPAKGASSPEAAVSDMMQAMADLNARRIIELLPPDEFAALHDYAGQFIDQADDGVKEVSNKYKLKVTPKLLTSKIADDRVVVTVADLPFNLKVDDPELTIRAAYAAKALDASIKTKDGSKGVLTWKNQVFDGTFTTADGEKVAAKYAKECLTITVEGDEKKACGQEGLAKLFSDISGQQLDTSSLNADGLGFSSKCKTTNKGKPTIGFTVIKREGAWYVSPTRTMLDSMTAVMKKLEPKDIECLSDQIEESIKSVTNRNNDPGAIDPTFTEPLDPDADPFATDTFPEFPDFPADSTIPGEDDFSFDDPAADTFPTEAGEGFSDETIAFDPIDSDLVDGGPAIDTAG